MRLFFAALILLPLLFAISDAFAGDAGGPSMTVEVAAAIVRQTNDFREDKALDPVTVDSELEQAAIRFAEFMAKTDKYGHRADGRAPSERATAAGYDYCVVRENIAYRTNTGEVTAESLTEIFVQGWIDSPPHRENMLADYITQTGVGVATTDNVTFYAVQLFGRPRSESIQLKIRNDSDERKVLIVEANDTRDEIEMPPRTIVKMTRCFPTTLTLEGAGGSIRMDQSEQFTIVGNELRRSDSP